MEASGSSPGCDSEGNAPRHLRPINCTKLYPGGYNGAVRVTFAAAASGRSVFEKFLQGLSVPDRAVILAVFTEIHEYGFDAKGCEFRQIEGKLWEIKIRAPAGGFRFFYATIAAGHIHVLHSYKKQGQKAPIKELEVARKRLREVLSHEK